MGGPGDAFGEVCRAVHFGDLHDPGDEVIRGDLIERVGKENDILVLHPGLTGGLGHFLLYLQFLLEFPHDLSDHLRIDFSFLEDAGDHIDINFCHECFGLEKVCASGFGQTNGADPVNGRMKTMDVANEVFDVVNTKDEVIGRERRFEVHRRGLRHRSVHVLLFNRRGEVFLQKRSMSKDTWPGRWDSSASGHLDAGEAYDACAVREVGEELDWTNDGPLVRILRIEACAATGQEFVWVYRGEAEGPFRLHPEEIEDGRWFEPAGVDRLVEAGDAVCAPALALIWTKVRECLG